MCTLRLLSSADKATEAYTRGGRRPTARTAPGSSDISGFDLPATGRPGVRGGTRASNVIKKWYVDGEGGPVDKVTARPRLCERTYISDVIKITKKAVTEQAPLGNRTADVDEEGALAAEETRIS